MSDLAVIVLLVVAAAAVVVAVYVVKLVAQLSKAAAEAERLLANLNEMRPQLDRILAETEGGLADLRKVTQRANGIMGQIEALSNKATSVAMPALDGAASLTGPLKYISAAVAGVKAVMQLWRTRKAESPEHEEVELQEEKGT